MPNWGSWGGSVPRGSKKDNDPNQRQNGKAERKTLGRLDSRGTTESSLLDVFNVGRSQDKSGHSFFTTKKSKDDSFDMGLNSHDPFGMSDPNQDYSLAYHANKEKLDIEIKKRPMFPPGTYQYYRANNDDSPGPNHEGRFTDLPFHHAPHPVGPYPYSYHYLPGMVGYDQRRMLNGAPHASSLLSVNDGDRIADNDNKAQEPNNENTPQADREVSQQHPNGEAGSTGPTAQNGSTTDGPTAPNGPTVPEVQVDHHAASHYRQNSNGIFLQTRQPYSNTGVPSTQPSAGSAPAPTLQRSGSLRQKLSRGIRRMSSNLTQSGNGTSRLDLSTNDHRGDVVSPSGPRHQSQSHTEAHHGQADGAHHHHHEANGTHHHEANGTHHDEVNGTHLGQANGTHHDEANRAHHDDANGDAPQPDETDSVVWDSSVNDEDDDVAAAPQPQPGPSRLPNGTPPFVSRSSAQNHFTKSKEQLPSQHTAYEEDYQPGDHPGENTEHVSSP